MSRLFQSKPTRQFKPNTHGAAQNLIERGKTMPNVQIIPAKKPVQSAQTATSTTKRKVAAYARVSSDTEEQLNSYDAQVAYYTDYIKSRPDWEYVDV